MNRQGGDDLYLHRKEIQPYREFLEKLIEDLREYRTLSEYAVRKIRDWKEDKVLEEIEKLMEEIGSDSLK